MNLKTGTIFIFSLLIGFSLIMVYQFGLRSFKTKQTLLTPLPVTQFSMKNAPSDTIDGSIATMSGKIAWQSRIATMPATLKHVITVQQGETLITKNNGSATLIFPEIGNIKLAGNSQLNIIQTLPTSAVMEEPKGDIIFTKIGTAPLAIKSLGILLQLTSGAAEITTDGTQQTVTIDMINGSATAAYTTTNDISSVQNLRAGDEYYFDNTTQQGSLQ